MLISKKSLTILLAAGALFAVACSPIGQGGPTSATPSPAAPSPEFSRAADYGLWAEEVGQPSGLLTPRGAYGINRFMTLAESAAFTSGRIVIGDSRCCQLGIYQQRAERSDFAAFGFWGGHYTDAYPQIMSTELVSAVERCFRAQIERHGGSTVFFFATVNDYDFGGDGGKSIAAAISAAERIASMEYEFNGAIHRPKVIVIGFDGFRTDSEPDSPFNANIAEYSRSLKNAVIKSDLLKEYAEFFTTVPAITGGGTTYIDDGLHYSDDTLKRLCEYVASAG